MTGWRHFGGFGQAGRQARAWAAGALLLAGLGLADRPAWAQASWTQPGADGPKPGELRPAPSRPVPPPPRSLPAPPAAAPAAEDPVAAATGDRLAPPGLRNLRDAQPANPEQVAREAGLRLRRSRPVDLRSTGTPPSAAEFGALLAPPR